MSRGKLRDQEIAQKAYDKGFEKGFREGEVIGQLDGFEYAIVLTMFYLKDKRGWKSETMKQLYDGVNSYNDAVIHENMRFDDIRKTLKEEYDCEFVWTDKQCTKTNMTLGIKVPYGGISLSMENELMKALNEGKLKGIGHFYRI